MPLRQRFIGTFETHDVKRKAGMNLPTNESVASERR